MPQQQRNSRSDAIAQDYVTVAERIEKFYDRYPDGRIVTHIIEHDMERGFILMRAEVYRSPEDAQPSATGHAYEYRDAGYVQKNSYIETGETSAVGRALAFLNFETKRGIASKEEIEKAVRDRERRENIQKGATEEQKQEILTLLENLKPGDRRAQRAVLVEKTGKESRDDLTDQEAQDLIRKLREK